MLCDICGKENAVLHINEKIGNNSYQIHICKNCEINGNLIEKCLELEFNNINTIFPNYKSIPSKKKKKKTSNSNKLCKVCGYSLDDFLKTGLVSCPKCYEYLKSDINKAVKKIHKEYLAEVVGCIWDALSNYGIKEKIMAINYYLKMRKAVKNAKYAIYVTSIFLQKRYPNKNINTNCSDVVINNINEKDLVKRNEKILKTNLSELSLATIGAIDVKYKGQKYVLKAISKLKKAGYNIKYYIIGAGDKKYLQKIVNKLNIEKNVEFTGAITHEEVFEKLDTIDIYIQPSLQEGLCRAIIEAMTKACPIMASNVGGNLELVKDKDFIFKRKSVRQIVKIIKNISKEKMIEQAEKNFENAKEYSQKILEKKRKDILDKFIN